MYKKTKIILTMLISVFAVQEAKGAAELIGSFTRMLRPSKLMLPGMRSYSSFHISDPIPPAAVFHSRRFMSSSQIPSLLESPDVKAALRKINGNCLKEIGAKGSDDFVHKSHRVVSLLKMSFTRGSSIDGQGGLADAEADWLAAWERQSTEVQVGLQNPHDAIEALINVANEYFYGIEPEPELR